MQDAPIHLDLQPIFKKRPSISSSVGEPRRTSPGLVSFAIALWLLAGITASGAQTYTAIHLGGLEANEDSWANAINNSGQVVGSSLVGIFSHATLFSGTGAGNIDLGLLGGPGSVALAINDVGQIVGKAAQTFVPFQGRDGGYWMDHATLFSGTGAGNMDLAVPNWSGVSQANDINNSGKIVGTYGATAIRTTGRPGLMASSSATV